MPEQGSIAKVVLENGSFDQCIAQLQKRGIGLWMPKDLALVRMAAGPDHDISTNGSLVNVSYNYDNSGDADILLASGKRNPLIPNAEKATRCHRQGDEFFPSDNEWKALRELAETDPYKAIKSGVLLLHRKDVMDEIPTHAYGEIPETIFIFEDQAKPYGSWLAQQEISSSSQYTLSAEQVKKQERPLSLPLWVRDLLDGSGLDGSGSLVGRVGGVQFVPAEQAAQKVSQETKVLEERIVKIIKDRTKFRFAKEGMIYIPIPDIPVRLEDIKCKV